MRRLLPLQQLDISQYLYEEFCDKWVFQFYERAHGGNFQDKEYNKMWKDFYKIDHCFSSYTYINKEFKLRIIFYLDDLNSEDSWTFNLKKL